MPLTDPATVKRMIRDWLLIQEQLFQAGGFHQNAPLYRQYLRQLDHLLRLYDLPNTPQVVDQVLNYPLSPAIDIGNQCALCQHMAKIALDSYKDAVLAGLAKPYMHQSRMWSLKEKVESIYFNLIFISETGFPEID